MTAEFFTGSSLKGSKSSRKLKFDGGCLIVYDQITSTELSLSQIFNVESGQPSAKM